jgi:hypothetical protein
MTRDELDRLITPLLKRDPFVPIALDLTEGERVVIDLPEQYEARPEHAMVTRRGEPRRLIDYDLIQSVTPFDQLPAGPGMGYVEFQDALRRFGWREPFIPFAIELISGRRLVVEAPKSVPFAGRFATYVPGNGRPFVQFSNDEVARMTTLDPASV